MTNPITGTDSFCSRDGGHLFDNWFDPIESGVRERVRGFIEDLIPPVHPPWFRFHGALSEDRRCARNAAGALLLHRR
jgi:hypothetical protein